MEKNLDLELTPSVTIKTKQEEIIHEGGIRHGKGLFYKEQAEKLFY